MKKRIMTVFIVVAIGGVLSLGLQSPELSNGISMGLSKILKKLFMDFPGGGRSIKEIDEQIRKIAHFAEYLILTTIIFMVIRQKISNHYLNVIFTVVVVGFISFLDEAFVQRLLSGGRSVSIFDIVYDMLGSMVSLLNLFIIYFINKFSIKK